MLKPESTACNQDETFVTKYIFASAGSIAGVSRDFDGIAAKNVMAGLHHRQPPTDEVIEIFEIIFIGSGARIFICIILCICSNISLISVERREKCYVDTTNRIIVIIIRCRCKTVTLQLDQLFCES